MKLAVMSDFHLGFDERGPRSKESFENAKNALQIALNENADAIILAGDIFDSSIPSQETLYQAIATLAVVKGKESNLKVKKIERDGTEKEIPVQGTPIIAIAGTHEYRGKDYKNIVEILEKAGFLVFLHASMAIIEKNGEKIAIQGLSGVPEKKSLDVLKMWNPKPMQDCHNILVLHQSIKEYLPFEDEMIATIGLGDLPKDFDLVVNGHLHWPAEEKLGENTFLLPGSTIITQMKKLESEKEKGIYIYGTENRELEFAPIPNQRKLFYHKIELKDASRDDAREAVEIAISKSLGGEKPPLVRVKIIGTLKKGINVSDISFADFEEKFREKAILSISRDFSAQSFKKKIAELRSMQKEKKSVAALGIDLLEKNLEETDFANAFDARRMFGLLSESRNDDAMAVLLAEKKHREKA